MATHNFFHSHSHYNLEDVLGIRKDKHRKDRRLNLRYKSHPKTSQTPKAQHDSSKNERSSTHHAFSFDSSCTFEISQNPRKANIIL